MRCARCDFRVDPDGDAGGREQLLEHAQSSGHELCLICQRSLAPTDIRVCEQCLTASRTVLSGVVTLWAELPRHLGHLRATAYDSARSSGDGRPLLGGDVLALGSPGSAGGGARRLTSSDRLQPERWWVKGAIGPLTHAAVWESERQRTGREHMVDNRPTDPQSVAQVLTSWEDDWRHTRGEPASSMPAHSTARVVHAAAGYLEVHTRWAAQHHPAFDEYVHDLQALHSRLERATGRDQRIVRAEAECFGCGADALVRELTDRGYEDRWTCRRCGETYDWSRYLLAVSGRLQESDVPGWGLPEQIAYVLGVNAKTVRGWADRGLVAIACAVSDKPTRPTARAPLRVWWDDARTRAEQMLKRKRAADRAEDQERAS